MQKQKFDDVTLHFSIVSVVFICCLQYSISILDLIYCMSFSKSQQKSLSVNHCTQVCTKCKPESIYTRLFDVTERTAKFRHDTGRKCHKCRCPLRDSIVHFGEKGTLEKPLNWRGAIDAAEEADVILCLGSSLKVIYYLIS